VELVAAASFAAALQHSWPAAFAPALAAKPAANEFEKKSVKDLHPREFPNFTTHLARVERCSTIWTV
jgi:hypothetical protein